MSKHTPGPWVVAATRDQVDIVELHPPAGRPWSLQARATSEANAARVVECVNALEGVSNPIEAIARVKEIALQMGYHHGDPRQPLIGVSNRGAKSAFEGQIKQARAILAALGVT